MLANILNSKIKQRTGTLRSRSRSRSQDPLSKSHPDGQPPPLPDADANANQKMGNTPSTPNKGSPKGKPRSLGQSSSLSSSVSMPGAEPPRAEAAQESPTEKSGMSEDTNASVSSVGDSKIPPVQAGDAASPAQPGSEATARPESQQATPDQQQEHAPEPSATQVWLPGTHVLLNARSGTALDLCGAEQRNVIGFPVHMGPNQQWEFIPSGKGYMIRSACPSACGLYLTVEELRDNAPILASLYPASWDVEFDEHDAGAIRISWPNTDFVMDLADWGSADPGTKVQLMRRKPAEPCQLWCFTRCAPASQKHDGQHEKVARSETKPVISETILVSEGSDWITTTRTTTSTVVTTVTTVTRTPRRKCAGHEAP